MHVLAAETPVGATDPERGRVERTDALDLRILHQPGAPIPPVETDVVRGHFYNTLGFVARRNRYECSSDATGKPNHHAFFLREGEPSLEEGVHALPISALRITLIPRSYWGRIPLHRLPTHLHLHVGRDGQVLFLHQRVSTLLAARLHVDSGIPTYAPAIAIEEVPHPRHPLAPLFLGTPDIPGPVTRIGEGQVSRQQDGTGHRFVARHGGLFNSLQFFRVSVDRIEGSDVKNRSSTVFAIHRLHRVRHVIQMEEWLPCFPEARI